MFLFLSSNNDGCHLILFCLFVYLSFVCMHVCVCVCVWEGVSQTNASMMMRLHDGENLDNRLFH